MKYLFGADGQARGSPDGTAVAQGCIFSAGRGEELNLATSVKKG